MVPVKRFFLALLLLLLAGCETTAPQPVVWTPGPSPIPGTLPTPADQSQPLPSLTPAGEPAELSAFPDVAPNINPLTGLQVDDITRLDRRPVMVKISNYPRAGRPHAGLSYADLVFEYYIGFGYNRFMAVYLGQDVEMAGPVRSGRLVDAQLAEMYQGLLFYGNADERVDETILKELGPRALAEKDIPSPPKQRIPGEIIETTLFVNTRALSDYVTSLGLVSNNRRDLRGMIFSNEIFPVNEPASVVGVQFSRQARGEWHYNAETGRYERWIEESSDEKSINMIPLVDRMNGRQVAFDNVVLIYATYTEFAPTLHDIALFDQNAGKRAVVFRDGVKIEATWKVVSNGRPILLYNEWGLPLHLKPGTTWFVLVGDSSTLSSPQPGRWEMRFDIP